jgi:hypothetical protein
VGFGARHQPFTYGQKPIVQVIHIAWDALSVLPLSDCFKPSHYNIVKMDVGCFWDQVFAVDLSQMAM